MVCKARVPEKGSVTNDVQSLVPPFNYKVHATKARAKPPNKRDQTMRPFCRQVTLVP